MASKTEIRASAREAFELLFGGGLEPLEVNQARMARVRESLARAAFGRGAPQVREAQAELREAETALGRKSDAQLREAEARVRGARREGAGFRESVASEPNLVKRVQLDRREVMAGEPSLLARMDMGDRAAGYDLSLRETDDLEPSASDVGLFERMGLDSGGPGR